MEFPNKEIKKRYMEGFVKRYAVDVKSGYEVVLYRMDEKHDCLKVFEKHERIFSHDRIPIEASNQRFDHWLNNSLEAVGVNLKEILTDNVTIGEIKA